MGGGPLHQKLGEILACHWSDCKNSGLLLAERAKFLKIIKTRAQVSLLCSNKNHDLNLV